MEEPQDYREADQERNYVVSGASGCYPDEVGMQVRVLPAELPPFPPDQWLGVCVLVENASASGGKTGRQT